MADAADKLCGPEGTDPLMTRLPLLDTKIRVAVFGGLTVGDLRRFIREQRLAA